MKVFAPLSALVFAAVQASHSATWMGATHHMHSTADVCGSAHLSQCDFPMSGRRLEESSDSITVSSTSLAHLAKVDVTFHVATGNATDRVTAYCANNVADTADSEYIDFQPAGGNPKATLTFGPLLNMRCDYQFRYLKNLGNKTFQTLAVSPVVKMVRGNTEPLQVHIALTKNQDEMSISWTSDKVKCPTVRYYTETDSRESDEFTYVAATGASYTAADMCSAPANITSAQLYIPSGVHYTGVIKNIPAGATVKYQVGSNASGWSKIKDFVMPDLASKEASSFFVFGDVGTWVTATNGTGLPGRSAGTLQRVADDLDRGDHNYQAVLHVGDLSYADSIGYEWEQFMSLIEPVASQLPYMVSVGNHEYCYLNSTKAIDISGEAKTFYAIKPKASSGGECGVPTALRFNVPDNGNKVFWYSFNAGLAHHVVLSSEHDFNAGSRLRKWLEADLAAVDRTALPWVFVHFHRSMYVSMSGTFTYTDILRPALEPVLKKYAVDAFFSGHTHAYERTCPVLDQTCVTGPNGEAKGPVHIMIGSAGKALDPEPWESRAWSIKQLRTYGYGRLHVHNATHAQVEFVLNSDGTVADNSWIVSDHKWNVVA
ncbi:hypothetical protein DYB38_004173 [Aphanomyces astaci]|uniref:Purple acid phosphatase n=2 Tax=Aphanomyces astaci TaxID=112090 RepID=A0A397BQN6_APHAT|nr:hypothetical protein DYB36_011680 [Aphanomyces astaci]RHY73041.1 hypothetical protein DYB38_004173 [Aphanomyces astaci]